MINLVLQSAWSPALFFPYYNAMNGQRGLLLTTSDCALTPYYGCALPVTFHPLSGFTNGIAYKMDSQCTEIEAKSDQSKSSY
jgi:hypothetical protein